MISTCDYQHYLMSIIHYQNHDFATLLTQSITMFHSLATLITQNITMLDTMTMTIFTFYEFPPKYWTCLVHSTCHKVSHHVRPVQQTSHLLGQGTPNLGD